MASNKDLSTKGFRFPAEWEPHEATWLSWPHAEGISFPGSYETVMPVFVEMVTHLATSENVCINVRDAAEEKEVRARFSGNVPERVRFFHIKTNEPWCRDHGPIFLVNKAEKKKMILDWGYNAWGGKYPPYDADDKVPTEIGKRLGLPTLEIPMILEGGSFDVNGAGTLLTTESCLLNENRNPQLTKEQIEKNLRDYLNIEQIIWLGDGIEGDDTDGHIDDLTRFISPDTVVTMLEQDTKSPDYQPLIENIARLEKVRLLDGTRLKIIPLPMPSPVIKEETHLPASYANFYIGNSVVLLPVFRDSKDPIAIKVMENAFPKRKIIPIDCRELVWGLGAFHCLTQQEPAV